MDTDTQATQPEATPAAAPDPGADPVGRTSPETSAQAAAHPSGEAQAEASRGDTGADGGVPADSSPATTDPTTAPDPVSTDEPDTGDLKAKLADLEAQTAAQAEQLKQARDNARAMILDKLGVKAKFRSYAPTDANPFTDEGRSRLEKFAADNPELLEATATRVPTTPEVSQVLKETKSFLYDPRNHKRSLQIVGGKKARAS